MREQRMATTLRACYWLKSMTSPLRERLRVARVMTSLLIGGCDWLKSSSLHEKNIRSPYSARTRIGMTHAMMTRWGYVG